MNILIIDDDVVDRMSAIRTLRNSHLTLGNVAETASADEGIRLARAQAFDIILLDYQLPPSTGIEVLRELRASQSFSTAIVMVSHSNDEQLALRCVEAGAQDFLMKSEVTAPRLQRAILLAAERYQLEEQLRQSHEQLRHLAERDSLTGLANRYFFDEALKDALPKAKREGSRLVLMMIDIDKFKNVNDTLGHLVGDHLLKQVAQRLQKPLRDGDKLCRLGGDEFAILVDAMYTTNQISNLVNRLMASISKPFHIDDSSLSISVSIGVATFPECGDCPVELMKSADVAMYRAKEAGRNQVQYYSREFHKQVEKRARLESDLLAAIKQNEFRLFYQPQFDAKTEQLVGVEALIRWQHPSYGLIAPDEFISLAEESNFINELGRWVISTACQQFSQWLKLSGTAQLTFSVAVNLSAKQLKDQDLTTHLTDSLKQNDVPANQFELELTESSLVESLAAIDVLKALSAIGVSLALDDFGTGYSSLSHLQEYPFDILKIDKSFVQRVDSDQQATMLKAVCSFAHSLGYQTVAEGIETENQKAICTELGVTRLQGYLFSKPVAADEFEERWLSPSLTTKRN